MLNLWYDLPSLVQDLLIAVSLTAPTVLFGVLILRGFRTRVLVGALLRHYRWTNLCFVVLIGVSVGLGIAVLAQERALTHGTARAANKFDLVIAAPGSQMTAMLAAVFLRPAAVPLLDGALYNQVASHPHVALATPLAFGDSYRGAPIVGTTVDFITHLAGALVAGRRFEAINEAVLGAAVPLALGARIVPAHGHGAAADTQAHLGAELVAVGRMAATGSPWDKAILVPVESVWAVHDMPLGHPPGETRIGPPFAAEFFPGTPAILVRAKTLAANYALRSEFTTDRAMAFFPGTVLAQLHRLLGDVRQIMSALSLVTQVLVTASVLTGLVVLTRLFARRLALMRALGAPGRFIFALVWCYATVLIGAGAALGVALGWLASQGLAALITARTDILIDSRLGWAEIHMVIGFVGITVLLALVPAALALARPTLADLRG